MTDAESNAAKEVSSASSNVRKITGPPRLLLLAFCLAQMLGLLAFVSVTNRLQVNGMLGPDIMVIVKATVVAATVTLFLITLWVLVYYRPQTGVDHAE